MRFLSTLKNDLHYQIKYGFYFLYAFFSMVYIAVLIVCPNEYKPLVASIIILTDPAMLGIFFIGGIWLLEKNEGLHGFWRVSPLLTIEYILSKAVSLALISALSAGLIVAVGLEGNTNPLIIISVFFGSMIFTTIGLCIASYSQSVNHYMLISTPIATALLLPPIVAAFGFSHPVFDLLPGTALWRILSKGMGITDFSGIWLLAILALWFCLALFFANKRIPVATQVEVGEKA